jgi:large repetitive protein
MAMCAVLVVGWSSSVLAQAGPTISTDSPQYLPDTTVTYTGTGWVDCGDIRIGLLPDDTFIAVATPDESGSLSGSFTAPLQVGTYGLDATGEACSATTSFMVVTSLPTTTTTSTTTTVPTSATTPPTTTSTVPSGASVSPTGVPAAETAPITPAPVSVTG